jgi:hypothetical protein
MKKAITVFKMMMYPIIDSGGWKVSWNISGQQKP